MGKLHIEVDVELVKVTEHLSSFHVYIVSVVSQTCSCQLTCGLRARMYVGGGRPPGIPKMAVPLHQKK